MSPTISIVMPCYNAAPWLAATLRSLINQTLTDFELICVNDGSTDQTLAILQDFAAQDPRITVFDCAHTGAGAARNFGLAQSTGTYLFFLDADDLYEPTFLTKMVTALNTNQTDLVICNYDLIDHQTEKVLATNQFKFVTPNTPLATYSTKEIADYLFNITPLGPWTKIFKRNLIDQYHIQFQNTACCNDLFFVAYYLVKCTAITLLNEVLVHHRSGSQQSISNLRNPTIDPCCHYLAPEYLQTQLTSAEFQQFQTTFYRLYLKTTCYGIQRSTYRQGRLIFRHVRQVLKNIKVTPLNQAQNWYQKCLRLNNYWLLRTLFGLKRLQKKIFRPKRAIA